MKKIYKLLLFTLIFTFCFGVSVFADSNIQNETITFTRDGSVYSFDGIGTAYCRNGTTDIVDYVTCFFKVADGTGITFNPPLDFPVYNSNSKHIVIDGRTYMCYQIQAGGSFSTDITNNVSNVNVEQVLEQLLSSLPSSEEFDPYAKGTQEGLEELGYVYNWGSQSKIVNTYDVDIFWSPSVVTADSSIFGKPLDTFQSGVKQRDISFFKADENNNNLGYLNSDDYEQLFVEFCYRGATSLTIVNKDRHPTTADGYTNATSIVLPSVNKEFPFLPYGEGANIRKNFYYPSSNKGQGIFFSPMRINKAILHYQDIILDDDVPRQFEYPIDFDFIGTISPADDSPFDNFEQYFSNDFYLGARYVALKDGHWIYGNYVYDYFPITGNNINLVPDEPENTIKSLDNGKIFYDKPEDVTGEIVQIVERDKDENTQVYYDNNPTFTFNPELPSYDPSDVNVTINAVNGNLVDYDLLNDNTLDTTKLQKWTKELVQSVKGIPNALSDLFSFFPKWVLNLFTVCFGLLIIFRLLDN